MVGGGLRYAYPAWGVTATANAQALLVHQHDGFKEWGAGGTLTVDPGAPGRGLALRLSSSWGGAASGGAQRLRSLPDAAALVAGGAVEPAGRLDAELRYGMDRLTPYAGVALAAGARVWRAGGRFDLGPSYSLSLEGDRREPAAAAPEHRLTLNASLRW